MGLVFFQRNVLLEVVEADDAFGLDRVRNVIGKFFGGDRIFSF